MEYKFCVTDKLWCPRMDRSMNYLQTEGAKMVSEWSFSSGMDHQNSPVFVIHTANNFGCYPKLVTANAMIRSSIRGFSSSISTVEAAIGESCITLVVGTAFFFNYNYGRLIQCTELLSGKLLLNK
jgi:hypothetical protein